jgi:hypothetical protein
MTEPEFTCKCIGCGKRFVLTEEQYREASEIGCVMSRCCNFPSTIEKVTVKE